MKRISILLPILFFGASVWGLPAAAQHAEGPAITVYSSPTCGCCSKWVDHLEANGFDVTRESMTSVREKKQELGVPRSLISCHTAVVEGYIIEGHVPADLIRRLLKEKPDVAGLAVPRMPIGSPGMEGPNPEPYDVIAFKKDGTQDVFAKR